MSFIAFKTLDLYARWRAAFLAAYPEKRLIPELPEGSEALDRGFITLGAKGKKIGVVMVAMVILLLASDR